MIRSLLPRASAAAAAWLCAVAHAAPPGLLDIYRAAVLGDPTLRAAQATLDIARQKLPEARAGLMPVVGLTGNINSTGAATQYTGMPPVQRDAGNRAWTLQLTQPIWHLGNFIAPRQAEYAIVGAEAQFEQARQDLAVRVATAYFAINEAQDAIVAADAQVVALREQLNQVTEGMKHGAKSKTDIDDTTTRLASAQAQRVAAENDLETARADLQRITGERVASLAALKPDASLAEPEPAEATSWADQARANHPAVRALAASLEVARFDVQRAQAEHLPTFDLVVTSSHSNSTHNLTSFEDYATHSVQHAVGVQVNVPLFAGGSVVAKVTQARLGLDKADADLEAARREAAADAQRAFAGLVAALAQARALDVAVSSGVDALKGNQAGFRVGVRTNVDVLNAEQQVYATRRDLSKARYDALLQGLKLRAAAGILDETDLQALDALFH